jgi:N-acetylmuramoyl-L-alanine amidase
MQADPQAANTWAWPVESRIVELYGEAFKLTDLEVQQELAALRFYTGDLDGALGPLAREAIGAFQRAWGLPDDGVAGPRTRRVLAVITAEVELASVTA